MVSESIASSEQKDEWQMISATAIIPARSGSKSIRDKNLALIGGHPLIAYSIAAAKMSTIIGRTIVSTDSIDYARISEKYGAEVPFLRPAELSSDISNDREFMVHAMASLREDNGAIDEYWVHLRPTTPLRDPLHIDAALTLIEGNKSATSLRSAHPCPESPFKWFRHSHDGFLMSIDSENTALDRLNLPRQSYPDVYIPDGYVDVVKSSFVLTTSLLHGDRVLAYTSPACTEVDSPEELARLEYEVSKFGSQLMDYLESCR